MRCGCASTPRLNRLDDPLIAGIVVHFHDITALARSEARARALAENASDVVLLTDGVTVRWISQAVERLLGYKVADLVGTDPMELVHPDDRDDMVTRTAESIMAGGDSSEPMMVRVLGAGGTTHWFEAWARNRLDDPLLAGMLVYLQDVTERERAADALRNSEARTRSLLDTAPDAIITVDAMGTVVEFNRAAETTFGWSAAEIVGRSYTEIIPAEDADFLRALTEHGTRSARMFQSRGQHRSGALFPIQGSIATVDVGGDRVFTTIVRDITEQKAIESRLKVLALNDPLTGLPNRQRVLECTGEALLRAHQEGVGVAALFIDLDRFKLVNDTLGHHVGDDLLREAATRITGVTRDTDIVGRLGGDEFVVICTDISNGITGPVRLAQRLTQAFSKPFELAGRSLFVTASIGIGFAGDATTSPADLLRQADTAMYRSKENGRARFELFDHTMQNWVAERLDLETSLRLAIAGNEIVPFYQPIVALASGQTMKLEALARWLRPGKGVVPPRDFIEIAEDAGLISAIGSTMLERATSDCRSWQPIMPGVGVAVNVSARRFATSDLDSAVERVLANNGLSPELLTIEITESALMIDPDSVIEQLRALREAGVRVALDDFGTGYSSLTYLRTLPIDTLKIDKTFIDALATNEHDSSIVEAILALGAGTRARGHRGRHRERCRCPPPRGARLPLRTGLPLRPSRTVGRAAWPRRGSRRRLDRLRVPGPAGRVVRELTPSPQGISRLDRYAPRREVVPPRAARARCRRDHRRLRARGRQGQRGTHARRLAAARRHHLPMTTALVCGAGLVGRRVARQLADSDEIDHVRVADRRPRRADAVVAALGGQSSSMRWPLTSLEGVDVVVTALGRRSRRRCGAARDRRVCAVRERGRRPVDDRRFARPRRLGTRGRRDRRDRRGLLTRAHRSARGARGHALR